MSEEFLRKYEQGEEFQQTIDEAIKPGQGLFDEYKSKADHRAKTKPRDG